MKPIVISVFVSCALSIALTGAGVTVPRPDSLLMVGTGLAVLFAGNRRWATVAAHEQSRRTQAFRSR